ncbi:MAG: hypothetical protein K2O88_08565 [Paramuribaculum sp.]|nr:hypothetical protein [Paramuribaculum sp.]
MRFVKQLSLFIALFFCVLTAEGQFVVKANLLVPGAFFGGDNLAKEVKDHHYEK